MKDKKLVHRVRRRQNELELEAWDLERVVEMTEAFMRRKEDAKFEEAFAELGC